jgi:hypothetical protein
MLASAFAFVVEPLGKLVSLILPAVLTLEVELSSDNRLMVA